MTGALVLLSLAALEAEVVCRVRDRHPVNAAVPARIAMMVLIASLCFVLAKAGS